jgi:hypothetical protein
MLSIFTQSAGRSKPVPPRSLPGSRPGDRRCRHFRTDDNYTYPSVQGGVGGEAPTFSGRSPDMIGPDPRSGSGSVFGGAARSQPSSWLKRSAAFRGRSHREEGFQGEETHNLWRDGAGFPALHEGPFSCSPRGPGLRRANVGTNGIVIRASEPFVRSLRRSVTTPPIGSRHDARRCRSVSSPRRS